MNTLGEVFAQSTDAVFGIDAAGKIRFANSQFESFWVIPATSCAIVNVPRCCVWNRYARTALLWSTLPDPENVQPSSTGQRF